MANKFPQIGQRVCYSATWLRSTGNQSSARDIAGARGRIVSIHYLGRETMLARIRWEFPHDDLPKMVNVKNLAVAKWNAHGFASN